MTSTVTEDSRQQGGTLTIGGTAFEKQVMTCSLVPDTREEGERIELLNTNVLLPTESTDWALNVGVVQDFTDPAGFLEFCRANAGTVKPFTWEPNQVDAPTYSGDLMVRASTIGGATRVRLTSEVVFPVRELNDPVYPV
jgi:hypothetical protein